MSDAAMVDVEDNRSRATNHSSNRESGENNGSDNNENDSDEDGEDDESSEEEVLEPKILPKRSTRMQPKASLEEGDEEFYSQEYWQEHGDAEDYEKSDAEEDEEPDEFDSDFFEDEDESDEEEVQAEKEKRGKKAGAYTDPKLLAAKRAAAAKKAVATKARAKAAAAASSAASSASGPIDTGAVPSLTVYYDDDGFPTGQDRPTPPVQGQRRPSGMNLAKFAGLGRKSVRKTTMDKSEDLARKEVENEKKRKEAKPKQKTIMRVWTQEEQLKQSLETEKENAESLANLLKIEAEKKKELAPKAKSLGPRILVKSWSKIDDYSSKPPKGRELKLVAFTQTEFPEYLQPEVPQPTLRSTPSTCVITNQPARYIDPLTHLPYATLPAYHAIRSKTPQQIAQMQELIEQRKLQRYQQMRAEAGQPFQLSPSGSDSSSHSYGSMHGLATPGASSAAASASRKRKHEEVAYAQPQQSLQSIQSPIPTSSQGVSLQQLHIPTGAPSPMEESPKASKAKKPRVKAPPKTKK